MILKCLAIQSQIGLKITSVTTVVGLKFSILTLD